MRTLAIDTAGEFGSIALSAGGDVVGEVGLYEPQGFSHILFDRLRSFLNEHDTALADIDLFAVASGPGSFTGVRVGVSAVKALAEIQGKPVVGVSNLQAIAAFGSAEFRAAVIDARRGEVYGGLFDGQLLPIRSPEVTPFVRLLGEVEHAVSDAAAVEWIASDLAPFSDALSASTFAMSPTLVAPRALSGMMCRLAEYRYSKGGEVFTPESIDADYVRRSDAELLWKGN